jgi:hypothetical protein
MVVKLDSLKGFIFAYIDIYEDAFEENILFSDYFSNDWV